jgi:hypothetical protein
MTATKANSRIRLSAFEARFPGVTMSVAVDLSNTMMGISTVS